MKIDLRIIGETQEESVIISVKKLTPKITSIIEQLKTKNEVFLGYKNDEVTILSFNEIMLFYSQDKKVYAKTLKEDDFIIKKRLYEIEQLTNDRGFARISNSGIANVSIIRKVKVGADGAMIVVFRDGSKEFVSRRCVSNIRKVLKLGGK